LAAAEPLAAEGPALLVRGARGALLLGLAGVLGVVFFLGIFSF